jgi:hypothetical protein
MQRVNGLEYEARGDGDAVLCIHGAIIADSFSHSCASETWPDTG